MKLDHQPSADDIAPFLPEISHRTYEDIPALWQQLYSGEIHPHAAVNDDGEAVALMGTRFIQLRDGLAGEICWLTGRAREDWVHLAEDVFNWLREAGCVHVRAFARPGWGRDLETFGFKKSHEVWDMKL